ncbi:MAG: efflux RND transporter permease subunit [Armatimonadetes bacterium]|nr:efflux RND transporter permease subunit [Armatimonadota bacterium]
MSLARFSVARPVTVLMGMLAVLVLGIMSWRQMKVDLLPDITFPVIGVVTIYPGAGPQEVEEYVTKPIEEQCGLVKGLKHISSVSQEGLSIVIEEFEWGTDMDFASFDTREKIDQILDQLPDDVERPFIVKLDPQTVMPVMYLTVTGMDDMRALRKFTDDVIKRDLEKVEGVASIDVYGGLEREIQVLIDRDRLAAYGLSVLQIEQALKAENLNIPGGHIKLGQREFTVRTLGEFKRPEEIEDVTIAVKNGVAIRLGDVAEVQDTHKEIRQYSRFNLKPAVTLVVRKESAANTVEVAHAMRRAIAQLNERLPGNIRVQEAFASADYIERALHNMYGVAEEGAILAVLIIFLFLTSARSTIVIATSIPLSLLATFILMKFNKMTLNVITMGGLTLAIGRIVDDSIVVLENVFRHVEEGEDPRAAAVRGAGEVGLAIMAATFTTVCVFFPIAYVGGLVGQIFTPMAITVTVALLASLAVALTVIPMLAARILRPVTQNAASRYSILRPIDMALAAWQRAYEKVEAAYGRAISWSLSHRAVVTLVALGVFLFSLFLVTLVPAEFFPHTDRGEFTMAIQMPVGTNVDTTNEVALFIEKTLASLPEVERITSTVGESTSATGNTTIRDATFQVKLKPRRERTRTTDDIIAYMRQAASGIPGAKVSFQMGMRSGQAPIIITISGDDLAELSRIGEEALRRFKEQVPELVDLRLNWERGSPEYQIRIDRQKAGTYGLSTFDVAAAIRSLVKGQEVTKFRQAGKEYDITVRLPEASRADVEQIKDLMLPTRNDQLVPLTQVAEIVESLGPTLVSRYEHRRSIEIYADKRPGTPLTTVMARADQILRSIQMPPGYSYEFRGDEKDRQESFAGLRLSLVLGIILIYIILASQFESVIQPFIIMLAIPLEVIGAFGALVITGTSVSIMVFLGILLLTGIVVSNSILLVHVVNQLRERGMDTREALIRGGMLRLRPILMTALATMFAMIPMALALREGSDMWRPLGITVLGGLISSTFLTLLVVPVAYSIVDQVAEALHIKGLMFAGQTAEATDGGAPPDEEL